MKKKGKVLFALAMMFLLVGVVSASTIRFKISGGLRNENGKKNTISYSKDMSSHFDTDIIDVSNVSGSLASEGIRVRTVAKRYHLGIVTSNREMYTEVNPNSTQAVGLRWNYSTDSSKTKIEWEDWTANTSFDGTFMASDF